MYERSTMSTIMNSLSLASIFGTSPLNWLSSLYYIIAGIIGISLVVAIHEFGHFLFAKLFNIDTPSFSIGFGPTLFKKKIGDTLFKFSAIPLGGYVEIAGSAEVGQGEQKDAQRTDDRSLASKPYYQKLLVMLGGILFNLAFAYLALIALCKVGIPSSPFLLPFTGTTTIETIEPHGPADLAHLVAGDQITSINNKPLTKALDLFQALSTLRGTTTPIPVTFKRNSQEHTANITFADANKPRFGITLSSPQTPPQSLGSAIKCGIQLTNTIIKATAESFLNIFKTKSTEGMGGPLMIISQITQAAKQGFSLWLLLLAFISISLAVLNLIPLPILDGGQILFYTIEAIIGRQLPEKTKMLIHYVSWISILLLILYLSFKDVKSIFTAFRK